MTKYFLILFLAAVSVNPISYAIYNWKSKNKFSAAGCILLVIVSVALPLLTLLTR